MKWDDPIFSRTFNKEELEIADWQALQAFYVLIAGVVTGAVIITKFIVRLEGKVKTLERLVNDQKSELSDMTKRFSDIGIQHLLGSMKKDE